MDMSKGVVNVSLDFSDLFNKIENLQNDVNQLKDKISSDNDPWGTYNSDQVGELLGVSRQTITCMVKDGRLTPIPKTGKRNMFRKKDIHKLLSK